MELKLERVKPYKICPSDARDCPDLISLGENNYESLVDYDIACGYYCERCVGTVHLSNFETIAEVQLQADQQVVDKLKTELEEMESEATKWLEYCKEVVKRSNEKDVEITRLKAERKEMIEELYFLLADHCPKQAVSEWFSNFKAKYLKEK